MQGEVDLLAGTEAQAEGEGALTAASVEPQAVAAIHSGATAAHWVVEEGQMG